MAKSVVFFFHLLMVLHYGYSIKFYLLDLKPPEFMKKVNDIFGGPFKFLTFWDMLVQFFYFVVAFANDLFGSSVSERRKQSSLQKVRDFSFSTVVFFLGSMVSIVFWLLFNLDRNLIFPELFDSWFPSWLNHAIHTMPVIGVLIELVLLPHSFPSRFVGFSMVAGVCFLYLIWVSYIAYLTGFWVYPILESLPMAGRAIFIGACSLLCSFMYVVGEWLNNKYWGAPIKKKVK
ncbi:androgen-dependent TFPI-regulating protein-like [Penaeus japonicus]|uniref:androgen-dependent TFPI-regulating protein-like n=1 Tax=Penaeus japonicus TaxID=27405 RepID=UPI001C71464E|nr:androgen-dependent TFPI-regulating protein-like [Penaeus japonicus]